jgi:hypothetical protein
MSLTLFKTSAASLVPLIVIASASPEAIGTGHPLHQRFPAFDSICNHETGCGSGIACVEDDCGISHA